MRTEKVLTMFFVLAVFLFGGATVASAIQQDDLFPPLVFSIFFIVSLIGSLNMIMWKLEVNGDEITWRSTFGRKRTFHFEDITYCERKKGSMRVYAMLQQIGVEGVVTALHEVPNGEIWTLEAIEDLRDYIRCV